MALLKLKSSKIKNKTKTGPSVKESAKNLSGDARNSRDFSAVLLRPHMSEKVASGKDRGVYQFIVSRSSDKHEIFSAIKFYYNKTPVKIRTVNLPAKIKRVRGKLGARPGYKKAYVIFKKGEVLENTA